MASETLTNSEQITFDAWVIACVIANANDLTAESVGEWMRLSSNLIADKYNEIKGI